MFNLVVLGLVLFTWGNMPYTLGLYSTTATTPVALDDTSDHILEVSWPSLQCPHPQSSTV